jgi:hypothetical protein
LGKQVQTHSRDITKLVFFASKNLSQDTAHNLATASLGQIVDDVDCLGRRKRANALANLQDKLLAQVIRHLISFLDRDKRIDGLASQFVIDTNNGRLANGVVLNESSLNLSRRQTMTADVDNVIDASTDPVEALVVTGGTISGELSYQVNDIVSSKSVSKRDKTYVVALVHVIVSVHVALVGTVHGAGHAGPGLLERQNTFDVVAGEFLAGNRVDNGGLDTEERQRSTARFGRSNTGKRCNDVGAGFRLPVSLRKLLAPARHQ